MIAKAPSQARIELANVKQQGIHKALQRLREKGWLGAEGRQAQRVKAHAPARSRALLEI